MNWERDAVEAEVYADEAAANERRGLTYDLPESLSAIAAKRRMCQTLTEREQQIWAEYADA